MSADVSEIYGVAVDPSATNNPHSFALAMVGSGKRVLEVGCSVGHVTARLVDAGNTVVGVEVDAEAARQAAPFVDRLHTVDLETVRLSTVEHERFDVLLLGDVLEHFRDPAAVLVDLLDLLAAGGVVVASVPHVAHVDVRLMLLEGTWDYQPDGLLDRTHVRWFTRDGLRRLLAECGLVATRVERVVVAMGGSNVPCHVELHDEQTLEFVRADPEWQTYQFVVTAERQAGQPDALAGGEPQWPPPGRLQAENDELRAEVEAWRTARIVRYTAPLRRLYSAARRRPGR